jgi:type VI secretion system protein ImpK
MDALQTQPSSSLLDFARNFLTEVVRLKRRFETAAPEPVGDMSEGIPPEMDPLLTYDGARQHLLEMIEAQSQKLGLRSDDREYRRFEEVRYILVAFADEIMVNVSWSGRDHWRENLLEEEVFRSHDAGERVFTGAEALLEDRTSVKMEAASVYLQVLALGFLGKFREQGDKGRVAELRRQLFSYIYHREPDHSDTSRRLFPQSYGYTVNDPSDRRLARLWPWFVGIAAAMTVYTLVGHIIFYGSTRDLDGTIERIIRQGSSQSPSQSQTGVRQ